MLLLALDTATPAVTVALHDGDRLLARSDQVDARRHGELLLPAVDRVLREAGRELTEVTRLVAGVGPGPYTGLRVGLATAESFGSVLGLPVLGLCTLDGIAYATGLTTPFVVATDARRKEVYWARYADARTRLGEPAVARPAEIAGEVAGVPAAGAGALLYADTFTGARPDLPSQASAAALAALAAERLTAAGTAAAAVDAAPADAGFLPPRPLYLRRPDAKVPAGYKVVTPR
ncbi:tRNA (adenosine(37)-N6)-threonylcarbamoyltransferase complex dimerization subunit type 1 TsaB [Streptomyces sp. JJ36]|uniref:tRNA (adenosine(37)-N6)-threonylcarbamoyltransferase complex dimerization subunit type 1 TsaB n=1 Tax=Streptomyces sp. JJ36 TaxID=2736645 RepID=UPI001F019EFA|nr:tRNA (adenosine(37)-N6)-threonylcarbamoyltransferase complex dimerization subunit type 1 TsaB [Streptomyces sp. JJ36]MCF6524132.1 tRNA (adenosine(37)-N6)-threonylcarbamoyltransferase complex dimerization subunit type 1 TsaB [Streptomyces sp. JJ36]